MITHTHYTLPPHSLLISDRYDAPHVQSVLGHRARLVEAERIDRAAHVDAARVDAVDEAASQSLLREDDSDRHRGGQRRRNDDGDQVEGPDYDV